MHLVIRNATSTKQQRKVHLTTMTQELEVHWNMNKLDDDRGHCKRVMSSDII